MLVLSACGGGGGTTDNPTLVPADTPTTGTVGIFITDAPTDRFDKILIQVTKIDLLGDGQPETVFEGDVTIDLRQLETNGELLSLTDKVAPGIYSKLRLYVDDITLVDVDTDGVTVLEEIHPTIPANGKVELNPRGPLPVTAGETLLLQIDIDAEKSIKYHATGNGEWKFRPVIFVKSGDADDFGRLTRMYGRIDQLDGEGMSFRLCQTELLSDDDDSDDYAEDEHCVKVSVMDDTGLFGDTGAPIPFTMLTDGDFVTVAGLVQNDDDDSSDVDEVSSSDGASDDDSNEPFAIDAVVVMQGEKGTFRPYEGRVNEGLDSGSGEFTIDLDSDEGVETEGALLALFQEGTRVFDKHGTPLEPTAIAPDVRGYFEGRLALSDTDPDVLRTALIILDLVPIGDEVLRGEIATLNERGFVLMTGSGDRCVELDDDAEIILISPDEGNGIRSDRGAFGDLAAGQSVDVYGDEESDGCFEAETIIVDMTVEVAPVANRAPTAKAGDDATVDAGTAVLLDGSASMDPDGDTLAYAWVLSAPEGSMTVLADADMVMASFNTDVVGDYVAELTVSDGEFSDSDSVTVTAVDPAQNRAPVADAGPDQAVEVGAQVELDGTGSFDPDEDTLTYSWVLETPMGSNAMLDDASSATPRFTADIAGSYAAILVVNDGAVDSVADEVVIAAEEVAQALNGEVLYNDNCASCHGSFAGAPNWTATETQNAIDDNKGGMGSIDLTPEEIQAIADALSARP
jgi:mono/diheme cytochrome c family protein